LSSAILRRLDVPTVAPAGKSSIEEILPDATNASAGDSLSGMAAISSPGEGVVGKSFKLCTAMSALRSRIAFSTSQVKKPTDWEL